jgi:hypothetical protein
MKKITKFLALSLLLTDSGEYGSDCKYYENEIVNDCIMKLYFYLLTGEEDKFEEFDTVYKELTEEQKELVKQDYLSILKSQEKEKKLTLQINK